MTATYFNDFETLARHYFQKQSQHCPEEPEEAQTLLLSKKPSLWDRAKAWFSPPPKPVDTAEGIRKFLDDVKCVTPENAVYYASQLDKLLATNDPDAVLRACAFLNPHIGDVVQAEIAVNTPGTVLGKMALCREYMTMANWELCEWRRLWLLYLPEYEQLPTDMVELGAVMDRVHRILREKAAGELISGKN